MPTNKFRVSFDLELTGQTDDHGNLVSNADLVNQIDLSDSALKTLIRDAIENEVYGLYIKAPNIDGTIFDMDFMVENFEIEAQ